MSLVELDSWLLELQSGSDSQRVEAARNLGHSQSPQAVELLVAALDDPTLQVQEAASAALAQLSPIALQEVLDQPSTAGVFRSVLTTILNLLQTGKGSLSPALLGSPWKAPPNSVPAIIAVLQTNQIEAQLLAIQALGKSGPEPAIRHLRRALKAPEGSIRCEAARALGQLEGFCAAEDLVAVLSDTDNRVASAAAKALGAIQAGSAISALIQLMKTHADDKVRRSARNALVKFADGAVPTLKEHLLHFDLATRMHLIEILSSMAAPTATGLLIELLHDPAEEVRLSTLKALNYNREIRTPAAIAETLQDKSLHVRQQALDTLASQRAETELLNALENDAADVRARAAELLRHCDSSAVAAALTTAIEDSVPDVRFKVAMALAAQSDQRAAEAVAPLIESIGLLKLNADADRTPIEQGLKSLGSLRYTSELVLPYLRAGLKDSDANFRREIVELLGELQDRRLMPELMSAAADPAYAVSKTAIEALRDLKGMFSHARHLRKLSKSYSLSDRAFEPPPPPPSVSQVSFSLVAPEVLVPSQATALTVWAHLPEESDAILPLARRSYSHDNLLIHTKAGTEIAIGAELTVRLSIPGLEVTDPEDSLIWHNSIANASFPVSVPPQAKPGTYPGVVTVHVQGIRVSKLHFVLNVGALEDANTAPVPVSLPVQSAPHRTAFASYASLDRDDVLSRIQGMHKIMPQLDIFVDVVTLRSGQRWADRLVEEIKTRDVFYLFWSQAAKESDWVEKEWRMALEIRGIDYIDPVPLIAPTIVPPPQELAGQLHFNDWVLAYLRGKS